jgi:hypothetical protein
LDDVVKARGTQLVIAQQNLSRKVTTAEYRATLEAACNHQVLDLVSPGQDARGRKGVEGLANDVLPSVAWGMTHRSTLEHRLTEYERAFDRQWISRKVASNVPGGESPPARFFFVMGGRAGAAVIGDDLYLDVLISEYRAAAGKGTPLTGEEVNRFFAHEVHHLAYDRELQTWRRTLHLADHETKVFDLLAALLKEGSATYLVNGDSDLGRLKGQSELANDFADVDRLFPAFQRLLETALSHQPSSEALVVQETAFSGNKLHVLGAVILDFVKKSGGKQAIFACMRDPRSLLQIYNRSVVGSPASFRFDPELVRRVATMGDRQSRLP